MKYVYLNQELIPGKQYLFHTRLIHNNKVKKFTGTFVDVSCGALRVEDYYDGKFTSCDMIFWTTPIEFITNISPIAKKNAIFTSKKIQT